MRVVSRLRIVVVVGLAMASDGWGQVCLQQDDLPRVTPNPEEERFLEDFGAALVRFKGMSLEEFRAEYGPTKAYADGAARFLRGDANGDGVIDMSDPVCTLAGLFLGQGACARPADEDALDANDSGVIDISDAVYVLGYLFLGGEAPPAPFPWSGGDPTPDGLASGPLLEGADALGYDPLEAEFLDSIRAYLSARNSAEPLSEAQETGYRENGFVILEDQKHASFLSALNEIYTNDLPVYIAADTLLDALHLSFDELLKTIEEKLLIAKLDSMLSKLEAGIPSLEAHSGGIDVGTDLDNVAFWLCTARSLLLGEKQPCARPVDATVNEFLGYVASEGLVPIEIFDVPANPDEPEDFSQFKPRGHYTQSPELEHYFRAMMWVQRIGMRFAQCPTHAAVAYLISRDLADTGAIEEWNAINDVVSLFVGLSDSLNPPGLLAVAEQAGLDSVADLYDPEGFLGFVRTALESGAGEQRIRSQVLSENPTYEDGFTPLPPMFHVMGQRFIVDSFVFTNVTTPRGPKEFPSPLDALFVLGNRATVPLLAGELESYNYHPNLAALDHIVSGYARDFWSANLYNVWLTALRAINADTTSSRYPPAMRTRAWEKKTLNTQLGSWAQLRHDTILYAKQSYGGDGCEYPEGWVDPYPELYEALAAFADKAHSEFSALGLFEVDPGIESYLSQSKAHSLTLASIARAELEGLELRDEERVFLKSIVRLSGIGCGGLSFDGWYRDIVFHCRRNTLDFAPTIADVHTCIGPVCPAFTLEVATGMPNLMLLSVKNDCGTKAYVGPVFSYFEFLSDKRWDDQEWKQLLETGEAPARPGWVYDILR